MLLLFSFKWILVRCWCADDQTGYYYETPFRYFWSNKCKTNKQLALGTDGYFHHLWTSLISLSSELANK